MTTPEDRNRVLAWYYTPLLDSRRNHPFLTCRMSWEDLNPPRWCSVGWFAHIPGLTVRRVKGYGWLQGVTFLAAGVCLTFGDVWEEPSKDPEARPFPSLWKFWPSYQGLKQPRSLAWFRTHRRVHHPCKDFRRWKGCNRIKWHPALPPVGVMTYER